MTHVVLEVNKGKQTEHGFEVIFDFEEIEPKREVVEVKNLKELEPKLREFEQKAEATGNALLVSFRQHPRDPGRKFAGFDKACHAYRYFTKLALLPTQ